MLISAQIGSDPSVEIWNVFIFMEESGREEVANGGRESRECRKGDSKDKFEQFPVQTTVPNWTLLHT